MIKGCGKFEDALLDMVYGELDEKEAEALRAHAADCPACASAVSELLSVRRLSSQARVMEPPAALDAHILEQARTEISQAAAPVTAKAPSEKPHDAPGFWEMLRAWLLHPAFAGAAMIAVVLTVTVFITDKASKPNASSQDTTAMIAEHSRETFVPPASKAKAEETMSETSAPVTISAPRSQKRAAKTEIAEALPEKAPATSGRRSLKAKASPPPKKPSPSPALHLKAAETAPSHAASRSSTIPKNRPRKRKSSAGAPLGGVTAKSLPAEEEFSAPIRAAGRASRQNDMSQEAQFAPAPTPKSSSADRAKRPREMPDIPEESYEMKKEPASTGDSNNAYALGIKAYRRGDCGTALIELARVTAAPLSYPGKMPSALHHIARCEKQMGRCARAVKYYEELSSRYLSYAKRPEALYEAAGCYKRMGRTDKARAVLKKLESLPGWESRARELLREL